MTAKDFFVKAYNEITEDVEKIFSEDELFAKGWHDSAVLDASTVRNILKIRKIACLLIDAKGFLDEQKLDEIIAHLEQHRFVLGPFFEHDAPREEHLLKMLQFLKNSKEMRQTLKMLSRPLSYPYIDELIRDTLHFSPSHALTDADAKRAVLSSLLVYFRQNVGSCFATAPAIMIHDEQPLAYLNDCRELFSTGRLKRTFAGTEYAVPISPSWGSGMLRKPIFLDRHGSQIAKDQSFQFAMQAAKVTEDIPKLVESSLSSSHGGFFTVEQVMKLTLLHLHALKEEDVQEKDIPVPEMRQQFLLQQSGKARSDRVKQFHEQWKSAKRAFKRLTDNAILRAWEYTFASFSESKSDFFKWNLYTSLGFGAEEEDGLGKVIYGFLSEKLEEHKKKAQDYQRQYEKVFLEVKAIESNARAISTEAQMHGFKMQYASRINELNYFLDLRDKEVQFTQIMSQLFAFMIKTYVELLPTYFQEIYDADMSIEQEGPYDDSPAGFRLLFKHGRSHPSTWTLIYTKEQFVNYLVDFFTMTEPDILARDEVKGVQKDVLSLISQMLLHLRSQEFLESAFFRVAKAHGAFPVANPLENLDRIAKKPWAYTSGGSMQSLIATVYGSGEVPKEASRWVESEIELLTFFADCLKEMPPNLSAPYSHDRKKSLLAFSPTHAFTLKPGTDPFIQIWTEEAYTYTWTRDRFFLPRKEFVQKLHLSSSMIEKLGEEFCKELPSEVAHLLRKIFSSLPPTLTPAQFRHQLLSELALQPWVRKIGRIPLALEELDEKLYTLLPLFYLEELPDKVNALVLHILGESKEVDLKAITTPILSALDLREITKGALLQMTKKKSFGTDYHLAVVLAMQALGFSMPRPIFFGDTNWSNNFFGFVVSPGSEELELWRLDYTGCTGRPILAWKEWLDGSQKKPWGVYTRPYEYGQ